MQHEERQPEQREGVLGAQLVLVDVHRELLSEPVDRQRGQFAGVGVDIRQVVAGVLVAVAGQREPAIVTSTGQQRCGEAPVGTGKPTLT